MARGTELRELAQGFGLLSDATRLEQFTLECSDSHSAQTRRPHPNP